MSNCLIDWPRFSEWRTFARADWSTESPHQTEFSCPFSRALAIARGVQKAEGVVVGDSLTIWTGGQFGASKNVCRLLRLVARIRGDYFRWT
jgi:hypothetical protein